MGVISSNSSRRLKRKPQKSAVSSIAFHPICAARAKRGVTAFTGCYRSQRRGRPPDARSAPRGNLYSRKQAGLRVLAEMGSCFTGRSLITPDGAGFLSPSEPLVVETLRHCRLDDIEVWREIKVGRRVEAIMSDVQDLPSAGLTDAPVMRRKGFNAW